MLQLNYTSWVVFKINYSLISEAKILPFLSFWVPLELKKLYFYPSFPLHSPGGFIFVKLNNFESLKSESLYTLHFLHVYLYNFLHLHFLHLNFFHVELKSVSYNCDRWIIKYPKPTNTRTIETIQTIFSSLLILPILA